MVANGFNNALPKLLDISNNNLTFKEVESKIKSLNNQFKDNNFRVTGGMILAWIVFKISKENNNNIVAKIKIPKNNRKKNLYKGIIVFYLFERERESFKLLWWRV